MSIQYILSAFWSADGTLPISYQFWFIRDLMVTVILTPLIYVYIKYFSWPGLLALAMLWYYGYGFPIPGLSMIAIFFFTFGAWFSLHKKNLVTVTEKITYFPLLYPLIVIADLLTERYTWNPILHNAGIIIGIFFWFKVVSYLLINGKIRVHTFLLQSAFFLFAIHEPLLTIIKRILFIAFHPQSDLYLTFFFFFVVLVVVVLSLLIYWLLKRMLPRFTTAITGGR